MYHSFVFRVYAPLTFICMRLRSLIHQFHFSLYSAARTYNIIKTTSFAEVAMNRAFERIFGPRGGRGGGGGVGGCEFRIDRYITEPFRRGKYPSLFTDNEANNCFSIHKTSLIAIPKYLFSVLIKWGSRAIFFLQETIKSREKHKVTCVVYTYHIQSGWRISAWWQYIFGPIVAKKSSVFRNFLKVSAQTLAGKESQFKKYGHGYIDSLGVPYDYKSIMHYPKGAFAKRPGLVTIRAKKPGVTFGDVKHLSELDVKAMKLFYNCGSWGTHGGHVWNQNHAGHTFGPASEASRWSNVAAKTFSFLEVFKWTKTLWLSS